MEEPKKKSTYVLELERRVNDLIRVYNPTDKDYIVEWDRRSGVKLFRVPSKQETVLIRYIAEKYIHEMFDFIFTQKAHEAIIAENQRRIEKGFAEMDKTLKTNEQFKFEMPFYNPDEKTSRELIAILYVGVEQEYGIDREMPPQELAPQDTRPVFDQALESIQKEKAGIVPLPIKPEVVTATDYVPRSDVFKCDFPNCTFQTEKNIALLGHKRSHRKETENLEVKKQEAVAGVSK